MKPQRKIVCAACLLKFGDERIILAGARHFDSVMMSQLNMFDEGFLNHIRVSDWEQGFIDQYGVFMDRKEAMKVAMASGQPLDLERNGDDEELYSEGLH